MFKLFSISLENFNMLLTKLLAADIDPITLTFKYPDGTSAAGNNFKIVHVISDQVDEPSFTLTDAGLTCNMDSTSPFIILYKAIESGESGGSSDIVDTGDSTNPVILLLYGVASLSVLLILINKSKYQLNS